VALVIAIAAFGAGSVRTASAVEGDICRIDVGYAGGALSLQDNPDPGGGAFDGQGNEVYVVARGVTIGLVFRIEDEDEANVNVRIDSETGSARITSKAEILNVQGDEQHVGHVLVTPSAGSQSVDVIDPDGTAVDPPADLRDPDGNALDDINDWLVSVADMSAFVADVDDHVCDDDSDDDEWGFIDFECIEAGYFHIDIQTPEDTEETGYTAKFYCLGQSDRAEINATRTTVETYPAALDASGNPTINFGESTIVVTVWDQFDNRINGVEVTFTTDNCRFSAREFSQITPAGGGTTVTTKTDSDTILGPGNDLDFLRDNPLEHSAGTAEAVLDCDGPGPRGNPGVANITAVVDRPGTDVVLKTTVTVVGPTASAGLTLTLEPDEIECGEAILATARAIDDKGAPVSNGTPIFFTIDKDAGVIAGGQGAQGAGVYSLNGEASVLIATDAGSPGTHSVIAYVRNAAGVTSAQVAATYTCDSAVAPAAPTVAPPPTGTGTGSITPPNTGDAGLAAYNPKDERVTIAIAGLAVLAAVVCFRVAPKGSNRKA
jgi:hypothetical protein